MINVINRHNKQNSAIDCFCSDENAHHHRREFGTTAANGVSTSEQSIGLMPHFSAFRPVSGTATSTSSKLGNTSATVDHFTSKLPAAISPQQSVSESSRSHILGYKVIV